MKKQPVPNPRGKAPLDKHGKPMTRMCPWCSYPMKAFMEGWLTCTHCNATDPLVPDSDRFLSKRVRPPLNSETYRKRYLERHEH